MTRPIYTAPILMSAPMVLAALRGARGQPGGKTVTRRFPTKAWDALERHFRDGDRCRLWVRETWQLWAEYDKFSIMGGNVQALDVNYPADGNEWKSQKRPSIHMPRWASRLTLLDVTVRRERLGDISEDDARAEGMFPIHHGDGQYYWHWEPRDPDRHDWTYPDCAYAALWNHLHGPGAWDRDQDREVMVIGFRTATANIDALGAGEASA